MMLRSTAVALEDPGLGLGTPWLCVLEAILDWLAIVSGAVAVGSHNFQLCEQMSLVARGLLICLCKVAKVSLQY